MHGYISIAPADPPNAMGAKTRDGKKRDFAWACRARDIEHAQARRERLLGPDRIDQRLGVIVLLAGVLLHCPDIRTVDGKQKVAMNLQMVRPGVLWRCDESHCFRVKRIAHLDDGK